MMMVRSLQLNRGIRARHQKHPVELNTASPDWPGNEGSGCPSSEGRSFMKLLYRFETILMGRYSNSSKRPPLTGKES